MQLDDIVVYRSGQYVRYGDAKIGLFTHALHYGTGCFEGVRGYWNAAEGQLYLFRLHEHFERMERSCKLLLLDLPETPAELSNRTAELVRRNDFRCNVYVRPIAFKSAEDIGVRLHDLPSDFAIIAIPHKSYFDGAQALRACVSSWQRIDDNAAPARAKITGVYVSSALAKTEAISNGFDEAIMLTADGHVAEGSAENIFIVRGGAIFTPPVTDSILEGITRASVFELCKSELGVEVIERSIDRSELYAADEIFFSGTAVGVSPVVEVDRRPVGSGGVGKLTATLARTYDDAALGRIERYRTWLTPCFAKAGVAHPETLRSAAT